MDDIVKIIIELFGAIAGSGSILCIYVSHRLNKAEQKAAGELEYRKKKRIAEHEWRHALGRVVFWLIKFAQGTYKPNGELESAKEDFNNAEKKLEDIEANRIVEIDEK